MPVGKGQLLVVEDDKDILELVVSIAEVCGFAVVALMAVFEVDVQKRRIRGLGINLKPVEVELSNTCRIAIQDGNIKIADSKQGVELCPLWAEMGMVIIGFSAHVDTIAKMEALPNGAAPQFWVPKPFEMPALMQALDDAAAAALVVTCPDDKKKH